MMDDRIEELLVKKLDEGLTTIEEQELNMWLEESRDNIVAFQEMYKVHQWIASGKTYCPDVEVGFQKMKQKRWHLRIKRSLRYVAVLIVLLTSGTLFWEYSGRQVVEENSFSYDELAHPGTQQAFFVWADGVRIFLNEETKDTLISRDGTTFLRIDSNRMLYYEGKICENNAQRFNKLVVPNGGEYRITLEDGTIVWVNSASTVEIPEHFDRMERRVRLEGEAYFEVKADSIRPFYVEAGQACIQVLGTKFNMSAYKDDSQVMTTLVSGKVKVSNWEGEQVILQPGEQAILSGENIRIEKVNPSNVISWVEGQFKFENTKLEDIVKQIVRWYDVSICYEQESLKNIHFSGGMLKFRPLKDLVEMIELSSPVRFRIEGKKIIISKK